MSYSQQVPVDWDWAQARQRCLVLARRYVRTEEDAQEAVQEALLRAWRKRHQCQDPGARLPWMLRITRNEILRAVDRSHDEAPLDAAPDAAAPGPDTDTDAILHRIVVRSALEELSDADRELLELRYDADLTQSAVAECAGMPEGTVKVRLHRLRNRLRLALREMP
jgi:RNA polymerase sigma-70 factor (ECF subfamily)